MNFNLDEFSALCAPELVPQTRCHALNQQPFADAKLFVKREDETGFAVSGGKLRKYASLLPLLKAQGITSLAVIGGESSNNVAGVAQLFRQFGFSLTFFLKKGHAPMQGNRFLNHLLIPPTAIRWIESREWTTVSSLVATWPAESPTERFILPEGASCEAALPGGLTLWPDVQRNAASLGQQFDHVFIDSGTGFTAAAAVLANSIQPGPQLQVVQVAGAPADFSSQLAACRGYWTRFSGTVAPAAGHFQVHVPATGRSFGALSAEVGTTIVRYAREEGLILDPMYSGKLFLVAEQQIAALGLRGNILLVHSGGGVGLLGYAEKMQKYL